MINCILKINGEYSCFYCRIKFFDEMANTEVNEKEDKDEELEDSIPLPKPTDFATKILCMSGLKMELGTRDMSDTVGQYVV